jgi:hypothetical protein
MFQFLKESFSETLFLGYYTELLIILLFIINFISSLFLKSYSPRETIVPYVMFMYPLHSFSHNS